MCMSMTNCIGSVIAHLAEKWINQKLKPHTSMFGGAGNIRSRAQDGREAAALLDAEARATRFESGLAAALQHLDALEPPPLHAVLNE